MPLRNKAAWSASCTTPDPGMYLISGALRWFDALIPAIFFATLIAAIVYVAGRQLVFDDQE